ncbi:peptide deformylase, mitochondrial-like [Linepithema humile]|uniref:peptide deformylase, mitochondrial-like n=1 Tax=Linepithema humile TaxID=83485 RepID=UPI000623ABB8|nr:PREDICTED: peptide deformylase, mitochondrial-like [Linepithema humile]
MMFRAYRFAGVVSHVINVGKSNVRFISFLKMKETFKHLIGMDSDKLPYEHVCQIGDPVLRGRAMTIDPEVIKLADFQKVIKQLISVMQHYGACGMSAPQIGLPWQMFAIEYTKGHMDTTDEVVRKVHEMEIIPTTVFINPELKIIDHTPIMFYEGCESIRGYAAAVPRAYEIEITALNTFAEQFTWKARGWSARIAQHEYDHLQGQLFIDKMDKCTFHCSAWEKINKNNGNMQLSYYPKK